MNVRIVSWVAKWLNLRLRKLGNLNKIPIMFRFEGEYPAGNPKDKLWHFSVNIRKKLTEKYSSEFVYKLLSKIVVWKTCRRTATFYLMKINLIASWITVLILIFSQLWFSDNLDFAHLKGVLLFNKQFHFYLYLRPLRHLFQY